MPSPLGEGKRVLDPQIKKTEFFDPSTPSMRKGRDGENGKKRKKIAVKIVATNVVASPPPNPTDCNGDRSCQKKNHGGNSGH